MSEFYKRLLSCPSLLKNHSPENIKFEVTSYHSKYFVNIVERNYKLLQNIKHANKQFSFHFYIDQIIHIHGREDSSDRLCDE